MNVAVLTLTRDRLDYTRRSFASLEEFAGCEYDHYVLDNGSADDTPEWLQQQDGMNVTLLDENIGIARGLNLLLDKAGPENYDAIVHFDNDCELTQPNTIRDLAQLVNDGNCLLSPRILGLNNPPRATGRMRIGDETILDIPQIGGICLTAPAWVYDDYRFPASLPKWGLDDSHLCIWWRNRGGICGYVDRLEAWHMDGTEGQRAKYPDYFVRKDAEHAEKVPA
jgi:glycosyltransferase involved in cell wall biosynthesis